MKTSIIPIGIIGCVLFLTAGCSTSLKVTNYPGFFSNNPGYQSMAVGKSENALRTGRHYDRMNSYIVGVLAGNEYYHILNYTTANVSDDELLYRLQTTQKADLVLFCTLTDYDANYSSHTESYQESEDIYVEDEDGNEVLDHTEYYNIEYEVYDMSSYAEVYFNVIDVNTGQSIYNKSKRGSCSDSSEDPDALASQSEAEWCAVEDALDSGLYQIMPTDETISVRDSDVIKTFRHKIDNEWDEESSFSPDDTVRIVFSFPKEALYNVFKFDIVYGNDDTILISNDIYWQGDNEVFEFKASELRAISNGAEKFTIRLWNDGKPAIENKIKIKD